MPHRTVFQWGKNHAHPFTMFIGGVVIGAIVTGAIAWAWVMADNSDVTSQSVVNTAKKTTKKAVASPSPEVSATPSPAVSF